MVFNMKKAILALIPIVGMASSAAISFPFGGVSVSNITARAHAGPNAESNNPHSVSPGNDPFRAQTPSQDLCQGVGRDELGTYFCSQVDQVLYTKVSGRGSGTYEAVTFMDGNTGRCDKATRAWSGELAPFNEPVSSPSKLLHPPRSKSACTDTSPDLSPLPRSSPSQAGGFLPAQR